MTKNNGGISPVAISDLADRLDTLIQLLIPPMTSYADEVSGLHRNILELCDYEHTTDDIQKAIGKSANHVNKELSLLRSRGLVKTVVRGRERTHVRLPVR
jgi:hypothetical protein